MATTSLCLICLEARCHCDLYRRIRPEEMAIREKFGGYPTKEQREKYYADNPNVDPNHAR